MLIYEFFQSRLGGGKVQLWHISNGIYQVLFCLRIEIQPFDGRSYLFLVYTGCLLYTSDTVDDGFGRVFFDPRAIPEHIKDTCADHDRKAHPAESQV